MRTLDTKQAVFADGTHAVELDALGVGVGEGVLLVEAVLEGVPLVEAVGERVPLAVAVVEGVPLTEAVGDGVPLAETVVDGVLLVEAVGESVALADGASAASAKALKSIPVAPALNRQGNFSNTGELFKYSAGLCVR